nr:DUF2189 domain-containing protein [uncultured Cohaesibacter sp.]
MTDVAQDFASMPSTAQKGSDVPPVKLTPLVQALTMDDLSEALSAGLRDFRENALYGLFFGGFYALGGWFLFWLLSAYNMPYLVYPLASGFALIAPFIAAGIYEVSRRREEGEPLSPTGVLGAIFGERSKELRWMALITGFAFIIWIDIAIFLYVIFFGLHPVNPSTLVNTILLTPQGAMFLVAGNLIGAFLSLSVFSITAVSFPMLLHKDVDFITAMITSIRCVLLNKKVMLSWAIFIGFLMMISLASFLLGLIVILPLLGHATWHLYRRAIGFEQAASEPT